MDPSYVCLIEINRHGDTDMRKAVTPGLLGIRPGDNGKSKFENVSCLGGRVGMSGMHGARLPNAHCDGLDQHGHQGSYRGIQPIAYCNEMSMCSPTNITYVEAHRPSATSSQSEYPRCSVISSQALIELIEPPVSNGLDQQGVPRKAVTLQEILKKERAVYRSSAVALGVKEDFKAIGTSLFCKICDISCSGRVTYEMHLGGRQHAVRSQGEEWRPMKRKMEEDVVEALTDNGDYEEFTICTSCVTYIIKADMPRHYTHAMHLKTTQMLLNLEGDTHKCYICVHSFSGSQAQYEHFASFEHHFKMRKVSDLLKFGRDGKGKVDVDTLNTNQRSVYDKEVVALEKLEEYVQVTYATEEALVIEFGRFEETLPFEYIETQDKMQQVERDDDPSTEEMRYCDVCERNFGVMSTFKWSGHSLTPLHLKRMKQHEMMSHFPKLCEFCDIKEPTPDDWAAHLKTAGHSSQTRRGKCAKRPVLDYGDDYAHLTYRYKQDCTHRVLPTYPRPPHLRLGFPRMSGAPHSRGLSPPRLKGPSRTPETPQPRRFLPPRPEMPHLSDFSTRPGFLASRRPSQGPRP